ncbi:hypothetical protein B0H13DRAFT_2341638 [Mycena leptocephala]|nr:hypothetical protein B0H13DRAFT_2341638 [Mycena leptocephala]
MRGVYRTYVPLGGTCETAPGDNPRTFSSNNTYTTNTFNDVKNKPVYLESPIWRYDPATQGLTAHWINPDGGEPVTHIALANDWHYGVLTFDGSFFKLIHGLKLEVER